MTTEAVDPAECAQPEPEDLTGETTHPDLSPGPAPGPEAPPDPDDEITGPLGPPPAPAPVAPGATGPGEGREEAPRKVSGLGLKLRRVRLRWWVLATLLGLLLVGGALLYQRVSTALWTPYRGYTGPWAQLTVRAGASADQVARDLETRGVIRDAPIFARYLSWEGLGDKLKPGVYRFTRPMTGVEVAAKLAAGDVFRVKVTLPEGWTAARMFRHLESLEIGRFDAYMAAWRDPGRVADFAPAAETLEGYLFPDTYFLSPDATEIQVIDTLVGGFRRAVLPVLREASPPGAPLGVEELVTLASVVEKETGIATERPRVASVIHNRLAKGMKLQCDPTVLYARWLETRSTDTTIYKSDLQRDHPYNTYVYAGLPPGPICNPGLAAVKAACKPESTRYLYFVADGTGGHTFTADLASHNQAVQRYRRLPPRR
ncbi:MAG: endolytic transglycosylase MltG [Acidobacteria bacterium]|nr:endolytic transglycosylase MltG [Acidobacteriota bacterium]